MIDGTPIMKYKETTRDEHWSHCITILWKEMANGGLDLANLREVTIL